MTSLDLMTTDAAAFEGIYSIPDAARYIRAADLADRPVGVESQRLRRWIKKGVADPDLADEPGRELLIAFEDLISLRIVCVLRAVGVGWPAIRRTELWLRKTTGAPRPFAREELWAGQGKVFVDWSGELLDASRQGQYALDFLRDTLMRVHGLDFDASTRAANSWETSKGIVLQPRVQYGAPCVKGTRIPTDAIFGMISAGDSVEMVMEGYGLSREEVEAAYGWEERLAA